MTQLVASIDFGLVFGLGIPMLTGGIIAVTAILTNHHRRMQRDDMEATLKMEMIQRGMAAEEIERVLAARMGSPSRYRRHDMGRRYSYGWQPHEQSQPAEH
jgi:hypothetical protein